MGLAADRKYKTRSQIRTLYIGLLANAITYQGGLVSVDANGWGVAATTTATQRVVGMCLAKADATGAANGAVSAHVVVGTVLLKNDATNPITQADVGRLCYVKDDQTVQTIVGGSVVAGRVDAIDATGDIWVYVDPEIGAISGGRVEVATDASTTAAIPGTFIYNIADVATADYDIVLKEKFEVYDVVVIKNGAGAANTAQLKHGATAVSDAIAAAVDKAVTRAGTLDPAQTVFAIGDTMRLTFTKAAGSGAAKVFVHGVRRA